MTTQLEGSPRRHGFLMPAEWAEHAATWIAWPHNAKDWPGKFPPIPWVYADIVRHLAPAEPVEIVVNDEQAQARATRILTRAGAAVDRVHFHLWPTNRVWMRDSGPIFLLKAQGEIAITDWKFNAWAKYSDWQLDNEIPARIARLLKLPTWTPRVRNQPVVLEGGSIDTNGAGSLLTTEECLLGDAQKRNPGLDRADLEHVFHDYLGMDQVLWLKRGIAGDDTHGHVDDIARFVGENTIVAATEPNRADENHQPLAENLDRLRSARNLSAKPFRIVELPMPAPVVFDGQRLPASYANFYIANRLVLVPTFNDANDRVALNTLAHVLPGRRILGIYCGDLIWGLGALHCMTQQQPL